eukprot:scaffold98343_cov54-Phaeocystis_antarctica.AAC.1
MQPLEDLVAVAAAEGGAADPLPPGNGNGNGKGNGNGYGYGFGYCNGYGYGYRYRCGYVGYVGADAGEAEDAANAVAAAVGRARRRSGGRPSRSCSCGRPPPRLGVGSPFGQPLALVRRPGGGVGPEAPLGPRLPSGGRGRHLRVRDSLWHRRSDFRRRHAKGTAPTPQRLGHHDGASRFTGRRRGGGDDVGGGGVDVHRCRTRASADEASERLRRSVPAGAAISPLVQRRSDLSAGFGQQGGHGGTRAPAPSDARFVSRLRLVRPGGAAAHSLTLALALHLVRRTARE